MKKISALQISQPVTDLLPQNLGGQIHSLFPAVCNIQLNSGEIISIITPTVGMQPLSIMVEMPAFSTLHLTSSQPIYLTPTACKIGNLQIQLKNTPTWNPRPPWHNITPKHLQSLISNLHSPFTIYHSQFTIHNYPALPQLQSGILNQNLTTITLSVQKIAGLGIGLTPAGDDFLMGVIYALYCMHEGDLATDITQAAIPLTTTLSATMLKNAGMGYAGIQWHNLINAIIKQNPTKTTTAIRSIVTIGATSGIDALAGFFWALELLLHNSSTTG